MEGLLDGRRVVITGAAANIGAATADLFAREGARIVIGDIDTGAEGTAERIRSAGGEATFVHTDLTDEDQVRALIDRSIEALGGLDVMINNAGLQRSGAVTELDVSDWDALMTVNPRSCFLMAKHGVPHLREADSGVIINTASLAALKGGPGMTGYSASKGAIVGFSRALAMELANDGVRVNVMCPGWVDTAFNQPAIDFMGGTGAQEQAIKGLVPLGRQAVPEEIARGMLFLASDMSSYMTGQSIFIDGGVY